MTEPTTPLAAERTYSGVAGNERVAQRRQRFIEVGIELFGTEGYHATTMRTLTAQAGLTNRYFYESFATMEDLLMACYEHLVRDYQQRLNEVLDAAANDVEARTRAGLTCFFEAMSNPRFARITHAEILGISPRVDDLFNRYNAEFAALMMGFLERAGVPVAAHDPREMQIVGAALAGSVIHAAIVWVRSQYALPMAVIIEATLKVILGTAQQLRVAPH